MESIIIALIAQVPSLVKTIGDLIARGKETGELTPEAADALTAKAATLFAQYGQPAPPPPNFNP